MFKKIRNLIKIANRFPYNDLRGKFLLFDYLVLRLFPRSAFPGLSIVNIVKHYYELDSEEEFRTRYYLSRVGFEDIWNSKPRDNKENIGNFYREHDKDIWRQSYFSKYNYSDKKRFLQTYHAISRIIPRKKPILDFGAGSGVLAHYLTKKGYDNVSVADIPSKTLDFISKEMSGYLKDIISLNDETKLKNNYYEGIVALDCLEHTTNPLEITQKLINALKPEGILFISFPKSYDCYTHIHQAQKERPEVFEFLNNSCQVIVPEFIYKKTNKNAK